MDPITEMFDEPRELTYTPADGPRVSLGHLVTKDDADLLRRVKQHLTGPPGEDAVFVVNHDGRKAFRCDDVQRLRVTPKVPARGCRHILQAVNRAGESMDVGFYDDPEDAADGLRLIAAAVAAATVRRARREGVAVPVPFDDPRKRDRAS